MIFLTKINGKMYRINGMIIGAEGKPIKIGEGVTKKDIRDYYSMKLTKQSGLTQQKTRQALKKKHSK